MDEQNTSKTVVQEQEPTRGSDLRENAIEWYTGEHRVTVSLSQERLKNYLKQCASDHPEEVEIVKENDNGVLYAHIPLNYVRLKRPRELTEEQRTAAIERLQKAREAKRT